MDFRQPYHRKHGCKSKTFVTVLWSQPGDSRKPPSVIKPDSAYSDNKM